MKLTRYALLLLLALCVPPAPADEVRIGVEISAYPQLVLVPGFPVYYAPEVRANYFFYEGDFWLFDEDHWYSSPWYDGPWERVDRDDVPLVILQVPVRYYLRPPTFFFGWYVYEAPRWGDHWGTEWAHRRHWEEHEHRERIAPAPLPDYQRHYAGERYPRERDRQHDLQHRNYRYQPHDPFVIQHGRDQQRGPGDRGEREGRRHQESGRGGR